MPENGKHYLVVYHSDASKDIQNKIRDQWAELKDSPIASKRLLFDFSKLESSDRSEDKVDL